MFWETLWALVLGFTLSGAVQAFVSKDQMQRMLGDHRPGRGPCVGARDGVVELLVRGDGDGQVAVPEGRRLRVGHGVHVRLHQPGDRARHRAGRADGLAVRRRRVRRRADHDRAAGPARRVRVAGSAGRGGPQAAVQRAWSTATTTRPWSASATSARPSSSGSPGVRSCARRPPGPMPPATRWPTSRCSARSSSSATSSPGSWPCWCRCRGGTPLFITGHGFWTSLENALVGPIIAFLSFVCSIGNVPMAAALWHGGISFGGVISFIFADLIALPPGAHLPQVLRLGAGPASRRRVLRRHGHRRPDRRGHLQPVRPDPDEPPRHHRRHPASSGTTRRASTSSSSIVLAVLYWLYRNRDRLGGGQGYAIDPVCGMQVQTADAPAHAEVDGTRYWFCSDRCRERFLGDSSAAATAPDDQESSSARSPASRDVVPPGGLEPPHTV